MVLVTAVRDYINRMLQDISGMKFPILDSQTVSIVSVAYSQSELLQKEVFLVELVDSISKSKESMSHLKAIFFLRPTSENIQHLRCQLTNPRFGEYHLLFSNLLKDTQIHILADSDEHEVVQQVQVRSNIKDEISSIQVLHRLRRPLEVIFFIVGGTTYEESRSVALQNASNSGICFILGGSVILKSKRFLKDLEEAQRMAKSSTNVV